jgi:hypothetical protein
MKLPFFKPESTYYPFRWFLVFVIALMGILVYANVTGWRILSSSEQEQWSSKGPGYHK